MPFYHSMILQQPCLFKKSEQKQRHRTASSNWSGYAISGQKGVFHRISGEWTVPYVRPSSEPAFSSIWIGIDGYQNDSLIQTGTGHDYMDGSPYYYAWWEILPAVATIIPLTVRPGDRMSAVIVKRTCSKWLIHLKNLSRNWCFQTVQRYNGPRSSAEWIVEAPEVEGATTRLTRLTPVHFSRCRVNGKNPKLTPAQGIKMIQERRIVSIPSRLNLAGDSFTVKSKK